MARRRSALDRWLERLVLGSFVVTMLGEWWLLRRRARGVERAVEPDPGRSDAHTGYERRDTAASLAMLAGSVATGELVWGPLNRRADDWAYRRRVARLGSAGRGVVGVVAALVIWDFLYYWQHRAMHRVRLLWAHHVSHHSSERYNLSTALRQPWSNVLTHWIFLPMPLLGIAPSLVRRAAELNLLYQYWVHTEAVDRLPAPAERILNTASHHRVHHGANPEYLDRNYGGVLIVWDRWFGTFEPERAPARYGLTTNIASYNPVVIGYHEFATLLRDVRRAPRWSDRMGHVLRPPGWRPPLAVGAPET